MLPAPQAYGMRSQLGDLALLSGVRQHKKMSAHSARAKSTTVPHQVQQSRSIQAPSVRAFVKLQDIQWHMMQRFERNLLLMRCGFLSEVSNHGVPSTSLGFNQRCRVRLVYSL
jgi:hypothetical protein